MPASRSSFAASSRAGAASAPWRPRRLARPASSLIGVPRRGKQGRPV
jgi:hypothetical protein